MNINKLDKTRPVIMANMQVPSSGRTGISTVSTLINSILAIPTGRTRRFEHVSAAFSLFVSKALSALWSTHVHHKQQHGENAIGQCHVHNEDDLSQEQSVALSEALKVYLLIVRNSTLFEDVLGLVHAELISRDGGDGLGQFFTPPDIASLIASLASSANHKNGGKLGGMNIYEPTCGSGGLLLAQLAELSRKSLSDMRCRLRYVSVEANDIDHFCSEMASLQIWANRLMHNEPIGLIRITCGEELVGQRRVVFETGLQ